MRHRDRLRPSRPRWPGEEWEGPKEVCLLPLAASQVEREYGQPAASGFSAALRSYLACWCCWAAASGDPGSCGLPVLPSRCSSPGETLFLYLAADRFCYRAGPAIRLVGGLVSGALPCL